jgi:hypothetical protein
MQPEKDSLTAQQSLDIITSMIRQTKANVSKNSFYFLLWGWTISLANVGVYMAIKFQLFDNPTVIFAITIPAAIVSAIYGMRQGRESSAPTLLDSINMWIWICFGITCFTLAYFGSRVNWQINSIIITCCAGPTFVTGIMLKFRPLIIGGIAFWLFGIVCFLVSTELQFLIAAAAVVIGYIIPGHMLRQSEGRHV